MPSNRGPRICLEAEWLLSGSRDPPGLHNFGIQWQSLGWSLSQTLMPPNGPIAMALGERVGPQILVAGVTF